MAEQAVKKIVVLFAMEAEGNTFVEHLALKKIEPGKFPPEVPFLAYSGETSGVTVHVVMPGKCTEHGVDHVGTVPSAVLAYAAVQAFQPDLLINAGTAGGFKAKGAAIGDVYLATHIANHDRRIPIPGFDKYGVGQVQSFSPSAMGTQLGLKCGKVSSGNSFDMSAEDKEMIEKNDATVKDMEAAGVAWVANTLKVPILVLKSVTDIVDGDRPSQEEFLENLHSASVALQKTVEAVIGHLSGKSLESHANV